MRYLYIFFASVAFLMVPFYALGQSPIQIEEYPDILYLPANSVENDSLQRLNLVVPQIENSCPLLIWIGGGAWSYVNRQVEMDLARKFAREGIAVASVGHRLSPAIWRDSSLDQGVSHPAHVEDLAYATKWLFDHATEYGYDREQIFIGGFSSGAHLATLISWDPKHLQKQGLSPSQIKGIIPISGAYDITHYHEVFAQGSRPELAELHVEAVFGSSPSDWLDASPTSYMDSLSIPMLIMTDAGGVARYTRNLEARLQETSFEDYETIYVEDLSHAELWRDLGQADSSSLRNQMIAFIKDRS